MLEDMCQDLGWEGAESTGRLSEQAVQPSKAFAKVQSLMDCQCIIRQCEGFLTSSWQVRKGTKVVLGWAAPAAGDNKAPSWGRSWKAVGRVS